MGVPIPPLGYPKGEESLDTEETGMGESKQEIIRCRYCGEALLSDRRTCPNCGQQKQFPFFLQGEFWGILVALTLSVIALASAIMK